jgi:hypothetical protein
MEWWSHCVRHWCRFFRNVCLEKWSIIFYVFVRLCVLSHESSCDGANFSPHAEIQSGDKNGEIWRLYWSNYTLNFFILCKVMNCVNVDFSFLLNNYGNSIHIFLWFNSTIKLLRRKNKSTNFKDISRKSNVAVSNQFLSFCQTNVFVFLATRTNIYKQVNIQENDEHIK